jgi:CRP-like cAMP-binding protein
MLDTKFKRKSDSVLTFLHNNYRPFNKMMVFTLLRAGDALRTIKMHKGEEFAMRGGIVPDYFFVIQGKVEITKDNQDLTLDAIEDLGNLHFFPARQQKMLVKALTDCTIVQADSDMLSELINWNELALKSGLFISKETELGLDAIRKIKAFKKLPVEALDEVLTRLEKIKLTQGHEIITQGEKGNAFYIIVSGEAEVWRKDLYDEEQKHVATLKNGDSFGEEALIMKGTRNATIKISTDSTLFKLKESDFDELLALPLINKIPAEIAYPMLKNGYQLIDVRYEEEFDDNFVPGSKLIPLPDLRERMSEFSLDSKYLITCASGRRASVAALLVHQHNIKDVHVIEGGMRDWPFETESNY